MLLEIVLGSGSCAFYGAAALRRTTTAAAVLAWYYFGVCLALLYGTKVYTTERSTQSIRVSLPSFVSGVVCGVDSTYSASMDNDFAQC